MNVLLNKIVNRKQIDSLQPHCQVLLIDSGSHKKFNYIELVFLKELGVHEAVSNHSSREYQTSAP